MKKNLTVDQKLAALSLKYFDGYIWLPKAGDYYTTCRNDLELYKIEKEDENNFYTIYCNIENCELTPWKKELFLKEFGIYRIFVPNFILNN